MAAQGWAVDATADTITFVNAPANGAPITVRKYDTTTYNATPVWAFGAWSDAYGWPREVEYFSDRIVFAGNIAQPQTFWYSKVGDYNNFGRSTPLADDDAITGTINAREINDIRDLVPLDSMLILTAGGEWRTRTGDNDVLTPSTIGVKPQSFYGASTVPTTVVGNTAVFVQDRGNVVRDLAYEFSADGYISNNLSVYSQHLLEGYEVTGVAFQQIPFKTIWLVRSDGVLLSLTYIKEQQIVGWSRHDTRGLVESICCVPEDGADSLYMVVRRKIGGVWQRYVERMEPRYQPDALVPWFVDSAVPFDGRKTVLQASLIVESSNNSYNDDDFVGIRFLGARPGVYGDEMLVSITTTAYSDDEGREVPTTISHRLRRVEGATYHPIGTLPVELRNVKISEWTAKFDTFSGLDHLEGLEVVGVADGFVLPPRTVVNGTVSYPEPYGVGVIGLRYYSDFESLEVNVIGGESVRANQKTMSKVTVVVDSSRNIKVGPSMDRLEEYPPRQLSDGYSGYVTPSSAAYVVDVQSSWSMRGRVVLRQDLPLPMTLLSVIPDVSIGSTSGTNSG